MKILMVSSEVTPFAKAGGLADAVQALSISLSMLGHDVRIVIPRYYSIPLKGLMHIQGPLGIPVANGDAWCGLHQTYLPGSSVPVYFIDYEAYYGRDGIYGTKEMPDFNDNPERYSLLSNGAFELCRKLQWIPDIIHAHDWPTAQTMAILKYIERSHEFSKTAGVLTIHNLGYQGIYSKNHFDSFRLPWDIYYSAGYEYFGSINMLKAGITCADYITTVSPTYAREIQTCEGGHGLDELLRHRAHELVGILNGVNTIDWNPETDTFIEAKFTKNTLEKKALCKKALQEEFGLPVNPEIPLIGMIARLTEQKGIGELFGPTYGCTWQICNDLNAQFVILGSGEMWCEKEISNLASKLPTSLGARFTYDNKLSHKIEAGADFFMMPSCYEPCGLNQMYSLIYGTLPIVHRTGGLADSVENCDEKQGLGTGFVYDDQTPQAILNTTKWAINVYKNNKQHFKKMQENGMSIDFSWVHPTKEYEILYQQALLKI